MNACSTMLIYLESTTKPLSYFNVVGLKILKIKKKMLIGYILFNILFKMGKFKILK